MKGAKNTKIEVKYQRHRKQPKLLDEVEIKSLFFSKNRCETGYIGSFYQKPPMKPNRH
jgi:hypothetical protein